MYLTKCGCIDARGNVKEYLPEVYNGGTMKGRLVGQITSCCGKVLMARDLASNGRIARPDPVVVVNKVQAPLPVSPAEAIFAAIMSVV